MSKSDITYGHLSNAPFDSPCKRCGAHQRTEQGHDPCIADLPGVLHACCGHGEGPGYVMFENGMCLHGEFKIEEAAANLEIQKVWGLVE